MNKILLNQLTIPVKKNWEGSVVTCHYQRNRLIGLGGITDWASDIANKSGLIFEKLIYRHISDTTALHSDLPFGSRKGLNFVQ